MQTLVQTNSYLGDYSHIGCWSYFKLPNPRKWISDYQVTWYIKIFWFMEEINKNTWCNLLRRINWYEIFPILFEQKSNNLSLWIEWRVWFERVRRLLNMTHDKYLFREDQSVQWWRHCDYNYQDEDICLNRLICNDIYFIYIFFYLYTIYPS